MKAIALDPGWRQLCPLRPVGLHPHHHGNAEARRQTGLPGKGRRALRGGWEPAETTGTRHLPLEAS